MGKLNVFLNGVKSFFVKLKDKTNRGYKWIGTDGIINMETSALLMMLFMLFFPVWASAVLTFVLVVGKCALDKSRGHENETHDFICAVIGILLGVIMATAHFVITLI